MLDQNHDAHEQSTHSASVTKILRLFSLLFVLSSFYLIDYFGVGQVGDSMQWKDGKSDISAGSHPVMLIWSAAAIALFIVLMLRDAAPVAEGIPRRGRRILAFMIDFWFSLVTLSSVGALIPLCLEAIRTGHFAWQFHRNYSVSTDGPSVIASLLFMVLMVLYFAFPLTRGKQTLGYFIMRLRVLPPFGNEGSFTFRTALLRTYYAFTGPTHFFGRNWDQDGQGRTSYDMKTNCRVVLVADQ